MDESLYDAMCRAIEAAYKVDVDEIRDLQALKRTIKMLDEAERQLAYIRLRAQRGAGELLRGMPIRRKRDQ